MNLKDFLDVLEMENLRLSGDTCFGYLLDKTDVDISGDGLVKGDYDMVEELLPKVTKAVEFKGYIMRKLVFAIDRKLIKACDSNEDVFKLIEGVFHDNFHKIIPAAEMGKPTPITHIRKENFGFQKVNQSKCKGKSFIPIEFVAEVKLRD